LPRVRLRKAHKDLYSANLKQRKGKEPGRKGTGRKEGRKEGRKPEGRKEPETRLKGTRKQRPKKKKKKI